MTGFQDEAHFVNRASFLSGHSLDTSTRGYTRFPLKYVPYNVSRSLLIFIGGFMIVAVVLIVALAASSTSSESHEDPESQSTIHENTK